MHNHRKAIKTLGDGNPELFFYSLYEDRNREKNPATALKSFSFRHFFYYASNLPRGIFPGGKASGLMEKNVLPRVKGNRVRTQKTASNERKLS